jgi:hypothetical protein
LGATGCRDETRKTGPGLSPQVSIPLLLL